jgi:hypothetical protein
MINELITPGDWELKEQGDANEYCIVTTDNIWVAGFRLNGIQTVERQWANGKLMAASKTMLEALQEVRKEMLKNGINYDNAPTYNIINNAIKKATEKS